MISKYSGVDYLRIDPFDLMNRGISGDVRHSDLVVLEIIMVINKWD